MRDSNRGYVDGWRAGAILGVLWAGMLAGVGTAARAGEVYQDARAGVEKRVEDLLSKMTQEEKVGLCSGSFESGGVPRLGVGQLRMLDGRQGLRPVGDQKGTRTTLLPCALALSCTWDQAAAERYGKVLADEMLALKRNVLLSPNLSLVRSPLGGRNFENFGEDPFLVGTIGAGYIQGAQNEGVGACACLMAGNDYESRRHFTSANMDDRTLREMHLLGYEMAVRDGGVWSMMTGNNLLNGVYCSQNHRLLQELVKDGMGFDGPVITDWRAAYETAPAALAGTDMTTGYCSYVFGDGHLLAAVKSGAVPEKLVEEKARRVLRLYVRSGVLDAEARGKGEIATEAHREMARELAAESMVLLKNEGDVLPLEVGKVKRILVTGPGATGMLQGEGSGHVPMPDGEVSPAEGLKQAFAGKGEVKVVAYPAMLEPPRARGSVEWETGTTQPAGKKRNRKQTVIATGSAPSPEILAEAAKGMDAVVFVAAGLLGGEGRDLPNMDLPSGQAEAIAAITKVNTHMIVVIEANGPVSLEGFGEKVPAMVAMHYGGEEGGDALADVLTGKVNPSGKLSYTFAKKLGDYAVHALGEWPPKLIIAKDPVNPGMKPEDRKPLHAFDADYKEGVFSGYRWFDEKGIEPWFAFGHGLSYTTFAMKDMNVSEGKQGGYTVACRVENTGKRAGAEVVEVYVAPKSKAEVDRPVRELKGFAKVMLEAGESKGVEVSLRPSALGFYDEKAGKWKVEPGKYEVEVGASSRDIRVKQTVEVMKEREVEKY